MSMRTFVIALVIGLFTATIAPATLIDFETLPDGSPVSDGLLIHDQYNVDPYWVTFELIGVDPSVGPKIAQVGPPLTAFWGKKNTYDSCSGESSKWDKPISGSNVGCFFLTDDDQCTPDFAYDLLVTYTYPVQQASGVLLDIDNDEQWKITAYAADETVIQAIMITHGDAGTGNGTAVAWAFDLDEDIYFIKFELVELGGGGLAFDWFSPSSLPPVTATESTSWSDVKSMFR